MGAREPRDAALGGLGDAGQDLPTAPTPPGDELDPAVESVPALPPDLSQPGDAHESPATRVVRFAPTRSERVAEVGAYLSVVLAALLLARVVQRTALWVGSSWLEALPVVPWVGWAFVLVLVAAVVLAAAGWGWRRRLGRTSVTWDGKVLRLCAPVDALGQKQATWEGPWSSVSGYALRTHLTGRAVILHTPSGDLRFPLAQGRLDEGEAGRWWPYLLAVMDGCARASSSAGGAGSRAVDDMSADRESM